MQNNHRKHIRINNMSFANIGEETQYQAEFAGRLNIIKAENINSIAFALGRITNNPVLCKNYPVRLCKNSRITADFSNGLVFDTQADTTEISNLFAQSREEDNFCFYCGGKTDFSTRLQEYKDHEYYFRPNRLIKLTNGSCVTHTFRVYLNNYIKDFKPQRLTPKKDYFISITESGELYPRHINGEKAFLSGSEQAIFNFLCFLNLLELWEGFEGIKDFNHPKKPLIITDFLERIDEAIPTKPLLNRITALNRQSFVIVEK